MKHIYADQIRGARSMQRWTREEMAEASGLSRNTICNLESGNLVPRGKTLEKLCRALEAVGLEFTDGGVRRKMMDLQVIRGEDSTDAFLDLLLLESKKNGGDIIGIFPSQKKLMKALGAEKNNVDRLKRILVHADMRFLIEEADAPPFSLEHFQYKIAPESCNCAVSHFVFGNSFVMVWAGEATNYKYDIFNHAEMAMGNRAYFAAAWLVASFLPSAQNGKEKRAHT